MRTKNGPPSLVVVTITAIVFFCGFFSCQASEFEATGKIHQIIINPEGGKLEYSNDFTVYVKECGWLIKTVTSVGKGLEIQREVGTINGIDIYDFAATLPIKGSVLDIDI